MSSKGSAKGRKARKNDRAAQFKATLESCGTFPLGDDRNTGTIKLKGRIFRSPRAGHFILQRTDRCCEGMALEICSSSVSDFDQVFTDSAGRSTYVICVSAACPVKLVIPVAEVSSRPQATLMDASQGMAAWQTAPWWGPGPTSQRAGHVYSQDFAGNPAYHHEHRQQVYSEESADRKSPPDAKPTFVPE